MIVETEEEQDDETSRSIGHPQLVLGDRDEAPEIGQARELVNRRELTSQPAPFDGVPDRPRQQALGDRAADEMVLGAGVQGHGAVSLTVGCREDQDGSGGCLEAEGLERLEWAGFIECHDHRILIGSRPERCEVRDPRELEAFAFEVGAEISAGTHQQHADRLAFHVPPFLGTHPIPRGIGTRSR